MICTPKSQTLLGVHIFRLKNGSNSKRYSPEYHAATIIASPVPALVKVSPSSSHTI